MTYDRIHAARWRYGLSQKLMTHASEAALKFETLAREERDLVKKADHELNTRAWSRLAHLYRADLDRYAAELRALGVEP